MRRTKLEDLVMEQLSEKAGVSLSDINMGKLLNADLGVDSLDMVLLIIDFEDVLKIGLKDADPEQMQYWRVGTLIDYLYKFVKD